MRVAVSTVAFPGVTLAALPHAVRAVGADGIALGVGPDAALPPGAPAQVVAEFSARCRDRDVSISAVYGYAGRRLLLDAVSAAQDVDLARTCLDLAASLGAPVCRIFAGTARGERDVIDRFAAACRPIADHAAAVGVQLGFPTHHDLAFDAGSCRRLVDGIGTPGAGIIFTGPNVELDGIPPLAMLAEILDIVVQAEVKDWRRRGDEVHPAPIGAGDATVWPVVSALARANFAGWITLHHLRQHHPGLAALDPDLAVRIRQFPHVPSA